MAENANAKEGIGITETGYLDRKQLESMKAADLKQLAADMGVDIADNAKKEDLVNALAAIKVDTDAAAMKTSETAATAEAEAETISKTEKVKADASAAENTTDVKLIYVGADLPGIKSNTAITGAIPAVLDAPFIRELVIPINKFTEFIKKKSITESRAAFCYRKSVEYAKTLNK